MTRLRFLALAVLLLFSLPVSAAKIALLIGNAAYEKASKLENPVRDAELLARVLKSELGFDDVQVVRNAGKRQMELALANFTRASSGAEVAFLYYSGHGMQPSTGGKSFLLPVAADISNDAELEVDGVSVERMVDELERIARPAKVRVVVLDACRNSPFGRRVKGEVKGLAPVKPVDQYTLVGYATNDGEVAQDGSGTNSPYAQSLAKWLVKAGQMPLRRIFEQTAREVRAATGQQQRPRTYGDLPSDVLLSGEVMEDARPTVVQPTPQPDADEALWREAKALNTVAAYRAYVSRFPKGHFAAMAEAAMEKLERVAYERAVSAAGVEALARFVREFPESERRVDAEAEMGRRRQGANKPQQTTPAATSTEPVAVPKPVGAARTSYANLQSFRECEVCPELVVIPAGEFEMGSRSETGNDDEKPQHRIRLGRFALGKYEVTQGEWRALIGSNTGYFGKCGDDCPVEQVSWEGAQAYIRKLNEKVSGRSDGPYRLPSEAEWEYGCRGGVGGDEYCGGSDAKPVAWYDGNSGGKTQLVGMKNANQWGLYDMSGNVLEWVEDCWNGSYQGAPVNGEAWTRGDCSRRVVRGGAWSSYPANVRSADRNWFDTSRRYNYLGFRVARTLP